MGWLGTAFMFGINVIIDMLTGYRMEFQTVIIMVVLDCIWGIARACKCKEYTTSDLMRESFSKLIVYSTLMFIGVCIGKVLDFNENWSLTTIAALICLVEGYSITGNMLIVFPNMPIVKFLRKIVKGEIASKLHICAEDVDDYLSHNEKST